jgi:predicted exporter
VNGILATSTEDKQAAFCDAYGHHGQVTKACKEAHVGRETVRQWEMVDASGFRQQLRDAQEVYREYLESLALQRVLNPEGNRGSDTLLIALNNANNPDKWRGNQQTLVVEDSVLQALASLQKLDAETRAQLPEPRVVEGSGTVEKLPWE